jgi:hypothetical protein
MIYDQYYLLSLGLGVTWDNPDISILQDGNVVSQHDLKPNTHYTIVATIYNASTDGFVFDMPVEFSYLSFGAGTESHPISDLDPAPRVTLGVKGTPTAVQYVEMDWLTPVEPGHYCLQVTFSWPDDLNPQNNFGQSNTDVLQANSPVSTTFVVRNNAYIPRDFRFELDTFTIPPQPSCRTLNPSSGKTHGPTVGRPVIPVEMRQRNLRADYPFPADWGFAFSDPNPQIGPHEERKIEVTLTPPDSFYGSKPINIHVFSGSNLIGGMTVLVKRNTPEGDRHD